MSFDAKKVKDEVVAWIRDWFEENGKGCNAVVAVSGGKDSSVVAALCVEALGKERVLGVLLPKGEQFDINVSQALVAHLGIRNYTINITRKEGSSGDSDTSIVQTGGPGQITAPSSNSGSNVIISGGVQQSSSSAVIIGQAPQ